jgi:ADP-ribose pyrophosphatase YjhB (NUDIX family)
MKYCNQCGAAVSLKVPEGDTLPRFVCGSCQAIHYVNPKVVVGCLPEWEDQILLCRRAIEPRTRFWTFPAGFMETGEHAEEAAIRETLEETQARVDLISLYAVFSLPHVSQVYLVFRGRLRRPEFGATFESREVRLFHREQVPWEELAFPVIHETLCRYADDVRQGRFQVHVGVVSRKLHERP